MSIVRKIKRAVRGEVNAKTAALEVFRRSGLAITRRRERAKTKEQRESSARLRSPYAGLRPDQLLAHFQSRSEPLFFSGFSAAHFSSKDQILSDAEQIVSEHIWPILGLGQQSFGANVDWHRDLLSGSIWPLQYHADLSLYRGDGSDVRLLWELNRLSHFLTLACAYRQTGDERFTEECLKQIDSWRSENPYGYGANWNCAMEVALRAINLLGAFEIFRHSELFDAPALASWLSLFDQHGTFIRQNLEFSYVATSNHYLSDVVGLAWLGIMLPELKASASWREFGLREMWREMEKQVLADGADFESATGYHRFVLELFLYTVILCRANGIEIEERYWTRLRKMLNYMSAYLRPDGRAPLIGDSDGGQVFPIRAHDADDHAYVLALGAVLFNDANLVPPGLEMPEEVPWIFGQQGVDEYEKFESRTNSVSSVGFPDAGIYVLRANDLSLVFNASAAGIGGRGSHGHNDVLGIEVSACGVPIIVDPGTCVYTADLKERHLFRSTAYHSTVEIDGIDQNTTEEQLPFVIGNEAKPRVLKWETSEAIDRVCAEHDGYRRLPQPVTHRRTVTFQKQQRWWLIEDEFVGSGEHDLVPRFHLNGGVEVKLASDTSVWADDILTGTRLFIGPVGINATPNFENQFTSMNYGAKVPSKTVSWQVRVAVPFELRFILIPACSTRGDEESGVALRFELAKSYLSENQ